MHPIYNKHHYFTAFAWGCQPICYDRGRLAKQRGQSAPRGRTFAQLQLHGNSNGSWGSSCGWQGIGGTQAAEEEKASQLNNLNFIWWTQKVLAKYSQVPYHILSFGEMKPMFDSFVFPCVLYNGWMCIYILYSTIILSPMYNSILCVYNLCFFSKAYAWWAHRRGWMVDAQSLKGLVWCEVASPENWPFEAPRSRV